jgi:hypothetical protein
MGRPPATTSAILRQSVDGEEPVLLGVAQTDLGGAKVHIEDGAEGLGRYVGIAVRLFAVELFDGLFEPGADACQLLLLHPNRSRLRRSLDQEPEATLAGLTNCLGIDRQRLSEVVFCFLHSSRL